MNPLPKHSASWNKLAPPLRPTLQVAQQMRDLCTDGQTLLLGVTPEFYPLFNELLAVDVNQHMIDTVWPGDTEYKKALQANWKNMTWSPGQFGNIISDGALGLLGKLDDMVNFINQCKLWLNPKGRLIQRVFERPKIPVTIEELKYDLSACTGIGWNGFKWKMVYYVAANNNGLVRLSTVRDLFNDISPDRRYASMNTGWKIEDVNTIDLYENIETLTFVPNREEWICVFGESEFIETTGYDLAETCPIIVWKKQ